MEDSVLQDRADRIRQLFEELIELEPEEQSARLLQLQDHDSSLGDDLLKLLKGHKKADNVLDDYQRLLQSYRQSVMGTQTRSAFGDLTGQVISHYEILEFIGAGGMGVVYKARDLKLDRIVALKCLPAHLVSQNEAKQRFIQEARAAARLDHPNICTVFEIDETLDGLLFIAMAFVEGDTLKQKIQRGPLPVHEVVHLATQIGDGLKLAHAHGVIHRDVKPANVIVTPNGKAILLDFGIARVAGTTLTRTGQALGTVSYVAPERVRGGKVDHRADLWSLGVMIYEMLTGLKPFDGPNDIAVLHALQTVEPDPVRVLRPETPESLARVVSKALQKDPTLRYQNAEALVADLEGSGSKYVTVRPTSARLPAPLTDIIGREREIEQCLALLSEGRLLTLTGPAGTGKTRLSIEVAARMENAFPDGVCYISLEALNEPDLVAPAIAHALEIVETASQPVIESLKQALRTRQQLLILDNFEQVAPAASIVAALLAACPGLKILVTSRMPLHISGEQEFPIHPLTLPTAGVPVTASTLKVYSAVQLFVKRAQAVQPQFRLTDENAAAVASLCAKLDGLPLALELAAARIKLFSPQAMLARLTQQLDLLRGVQFDRPARHQTLRQAIDWSYDLLDDNQQQFFRCVTTFPGGFTLEAIRAVCSSLDEPKILDYLEALVEQSMLKRDDRFDEEPRFYMLETLRTYGLERLEESSDAKEVRDAHLNYYITLAEKAEEELNGPDAARWLDRLEEEHNNFRAALAWAARSRNIEAELRLGAALSGFWATRGYLHEGQQRLEKMLTTLSTNVSAAIRAKALNSLGILTFLLGDFRVAETVLEESLSLWQKVGDPEGIANVMNDLTWVALELSDSIKARKLADQTLVLSRRLNLTRSTAVSLYNLGWLESYAGRCRNACDALEESLSLYRSINDIRGEALTCLSLAWVETLKGRFDQASVYQESAREILHDVKDPLFGAWALFVRGLIHLEQGDFNPASDLLAQSISAWRTVGYRPGLGWALCTQSLVYIFQEKPDKSLECLQEADALYMILTCKWGISLMHYCLGLVAHLQGDLEKTLKHLNFSLNLRSKSDLYLSTVECLEALAGIYIERNYPELALRLLGASLAERERLEAPVPPRLLDRFELYHQELRSALEPETYEQTWAEGRSLTLDQTVALVLE